MKRTEMMNNYTKEQINEAIYTVLTSEYKKDAPEAFNIVKAVGYEYSKYDRGRFEVYNPVTKRRIYIKEGGYYKNYHVSVYYGYYANQVARFTGDDRYLDAKGKFNYVGCLEKPVNMVWREVCQMQDVRSQAVQKYDILCTKKSYVKWREDEIQRIQMQMQKLQKELISATERKVGYERDVMDYRKQIGLA